MVNQIKVLALDIDGVLTDGRAGIASEGTLSKVIAFHDLDAVTAARRAGLEIVLVTGEHGPEVDQIASRFGVKEVVRNAKDKVAALRETSARLGVPLKAFCYVGDSDRDAPAFADVGLGLAPANATPAALAGARQVLSRRGGDGAVAEAVRLILGMRENSQNNEELGAEMKRIAAESIAAHQRLVGEGVQVLVEVAQAFIAAIASGRKILLFGNGGSAADAQHVAGELVGRFLVESEPWPAIALTTDSSIVTCIGNDWAFEEVFARQVRALCQPGDVVVGITTSGRSPNVVKGLQEARRRQGITVGFTGAKGTALLAHSDICFLAPADATPRIQELHLLAWHSICEVVERELMKIRR